MIFGALRESFVSWTPWSPRTGRWRIFRTAVTDGPGPAGHPALLRRPAEDATFHFKSVSALSMPMRAPRTGCWTSSARSNCRSCSCSIAAASWPFPGGQQGDGPHHGARHAARIARNTVAVGDAENDHELLRLAEVGAAVEWGSRRCKPQRIS